MEGVPASMSTVLTVIMPKKSLASAHSDCDMSNMISNGSEVLHNRSQVECISISFVNSGLPLMMLSIVIFNSLLNSTEM